jgi:CrcB protein
VVTDATTRRRWQPSLPGGRPVPRRDTLSDNRGPASAGAFPASTWAINVLGCALIGVLMVLITEVWSRQRLLRPFLGTGVLGGFTTFSTYTVDIQRLVAGAHLGTALLYLTLTPIGALLAVWVTATATRRLVNWRIR